MLADRARMAAGGVGGVTVVGYDDDTDTTDGTSFSFTLSITGSWDSAIIGVMVEGISSSPAITSVTVDTTSATEGVTITQPFKRSSIYSIIKAGSTSVDVVVTTSVTTADCSVGFIALNGLGSTTPGDTDTKQNTATLDFSTDVTANGILVASVGDWRGVASAISTAWSGETAEIFDKHYDAGGGNYGYHCMSYYLPTADATGYALAGTMTNEGASAAVAAAFPAA